MPQQEPIKEKYPNTQLIKDLWHFVRPKKTEFIILSIFLAISSLLALAPPLIIARVIDYITGGGRSLNAFYIYILILLSVMVVENIIGLGTKHFFNLFIIKIQKSAKVESMQKVLHGDLLWHDKENTGNKMQKVQAGETAMETFLRFYINQGVSMVVTIIGVIAVFSFFNIKYAIIGLAYLVVYIFTEFKLNKKLSEKVQALKRAEENAAGKAYEFSANISTIKSLGIEKSSQSQIVGQEETVEQARKERRLASTQKWIAVELVSTLFFVLFIFFVGKDIILALLTVGSIVIYVEYSRRLSGTLNLVSNVINYLIEGKFGMKRMMDIHRSIYNYDEADAKPLPAWQTIKIKGVSFAYKQTKVLDNLNLTIGRGQKIGIVGTSGTGKSTLFKLLLKLYLPQQGEIYFDDISIKKITGDSILKKIAIVPQDTELFNLSIRDNITISEADAIDDQKYQLATSISQVNKIIAKLPEGDLTMVGEKGIRLSGGEKQRLGIARAIYKNADIIIFDEATSNLDYITEKNILNAIDSQLKEKTLIIAAHRLETLKSMDLVVLMDQGKITEQGTYSQLITQAGQFSQLLKKQKNQPPKTTL